MHVALTEFEASNKLAFIWAGRFLVHDVLRHVGRGHNTSRHNLRHAVPVPVHGVMSKDKSGPSYIDVFDDTYLRDKFIFIPIELIFKTKTLGMY